MKYTLQEVKEMLLKEIKETKQGTMLMLEDNPDDNSLYSTFSWLEKTEENIEIIINNLIEQWI